MSNPIFAVKEDDLEVLEKELPRLAEFSQMAMNSEGELLWNLRPDIREAWDMVREIVSRVRWGGFGNPEKIENIT